MFFGKIEAGFLIVRILAETFAGFFAATVTRTLSAGLFHHLHFFGRNESRGDGKIHTFFQMFVFGAINIALFSTLASRRLNPLFKGFKHFFSIFYFFWGHKTGSYRKGHAPLHIFWLRTVAVTFFFSTARRRFDSPLDRLEHLLSVFNFIRRNKPSGFSESYTFFHIVWLRTVAIARLSTPARRWPSASLNRFEYFSGVIYFIRRNKASGFSEGDALFHVVGIITIIVTFLLIAAVARRF